MKLFRFSSSETDFFAADTREQAVDAYQREYGLTARDMGDVAVDEADPNTIEVYPDGWDYDSDEAPPTAAEIMQTMKRPGLVASTNS